MGPFPPSNGKQYIIVAVEYVSKWVEAEACAVSDAKQVIKFLKKNIFTRFGIPRAIISDGGSHFINRVVNQLLAKFNLHHRVTTPYHPQVNGQVEVSNRELKRILEAIVGKAKREWAFKVDEALWAYRTAFKTPIGMTPFKLVYGKSCHLPLELEYKSLWALKKLNFDFKEAQEKRRIDLNELDEIRLHAYESARVYKERTKLYHDKRIRPREFEIGQKVLLYNSRFKLFPGKLRTKWSGPFEISKVYESGAVVLKADDGREFTVNGQRVKHYLGDEVRFIEQITCRPTLN